MTRFDFPTARLEKWIAHRVLSPRLRPLPFSTQRYARALTENEAMQLRFTERMKCFRSRRPLSAVTVPVFCFSDWLADPKNHRIHVR